MIYRAIYRIKSFQNGSRNTAMLLYLRNDKVFTTFIGRF